MQLFHHYPQRLDSIIRSDFWHFELSIWLHTIARSFVAVFVPVLILQAGYPLKNIVIYYVLYMAFDVPLNVVARFLVTKIGAKKVIVIGVISLITFLFLLLELSVSWPMLILLAFTAGAYDAMYWVAHIFLFIESVQHPQEGGKDTSFLYIVKKIGGMLGPAIGAGAFLLFGKIGMLGLSIIFLVLSLVPLFKAKRLLDKPKKEQPSFKEFFKDRRERANFAIKGFYSIHIEAEETFIPLFIFLTFETIESVSVIPIIISIASIISSYTTGHIRGEEKRYKLIALGAALVGLVWVIRIIFEHPLLYYISIFAVGFLSLFIILPLDSNIVERAKKTDPLASATYRNIFSMASKLMFYGVLALLLYVFNVAFILAAISMLGVVILIQLFLLPLLHSQHQTTFTKN